MTKGEKLHKEIIELILTEGTLDENPRPKYADGTPAHTLSVNHIVTQYDLTKGESPMITLRPIAWRSAIKEILWIYQMQSNKLKDLHDMYISYWDEWDIGDGTIGQRYGATIKKYNLMNKLLDGLVKDPFGRRHIISMWQEDDFDSPGLNPCCYETIWNVHKKDGVMYLDMMLIQRSSDFVVSSTINEIQYQALLLMVAKHCGYIPGKFTHVTANAQIYDRHIDQAKVILNREPLDMSPMPLKLQTDETNFYDFTINDFVMEQYSLDITKKYNPQLTFDLGI